MLTGDDLGRALRALPCYVRVLAWPAHHMPAAAQLRFSRLQAMPHQSMKCIIQAAATSCWPRTVTPAEKPPCRKAQTVSQTNTSTLDDHAAVTQPGAVGAARATSSGAAAGRTSQNTSRPGGGAGT